MTLVSSSGSDILDNAAQDMLRHATLPPPDPPAEQLTVSVQIRYRLTD